MATSPNTKTPPETLEVRTHRVSCNGGGVLGHPKIYMDMGQENSVQCKYCDRLFILKA